MSYKRQITNRLVIGRADPLHVPLHIWEIGFVAQITLKDTKERLSEILQSLGLLPVPYLPPGHLSEMQKGPADFSDGTLSSCSAEVMA